MLVSMRLSVALLNVQFSALEEKIPFRLSTPHIVTLNQSNRYCKFGEKIP